MHVAIVTTHPPGKGSLNEYAYHFVRALRQKQEVSQVTLLVDALPEGATYPEIEQLAGSAPVSMTSCWRFDDVRNADRILAAVRQAPSPMLCYSTCSLPPLAAAKSPQA